MPILVSSFRLGVFMKVIKKSDPEQSLREPIMIIIGLTKMYSKVY